MKNLPQVKLPKKLVVFVLVVAITALTFWLSPESRFYIIVGTVIVAFATLVFGLELFKKSKSEWAAILGVAFFMIVISFIVWAVSRSDVINQQQESAPAIASNPCEVVLTIVGLQWQADQAPVYHCDSVANIEALIRFQTEMFGETNWSERQIVALLGPNKDQWNTNALLVERTAYAEALHAHQNQRFYVDFADWTSLFVIAVLMPFFVSILGWFNLPKYNTWGPFMILLVPAGAFVLANSLYEEDYFSIFLVAGVVELITFAIPMVASWGILKIRNAYAVFFIQTAIEAPGILVFVVPFLTNMVIMNLNFTMGMVIDVYLLGMFAGKAVISLYFFIQAWFRGEA